MSFDIAVNFTITKIEGGWVETGSATRKPTPAAYTFAGITQARGSR